MGGAVHIRGSIPGLTNDRVSRGQAAVVEVEGRRQLLLAGLGQMLGDQNVAVQKGL